MHITRIAMYLALILINVFEKLSHNILVKIYHFRCTSLNISLYTLLKQYYNSEYLPVESDGKVSVFPPSPMYITARIPKNKASTTTKITDTIF